MERKVFMPLSFSAAVSLSLSLSLSSSHQSLYLSAEAVSLSATVHLSATVSHTAVVSLTAAVSLLSASVSFTSLSFPHQQLSLSLTRLSCLSRCLSLSQQLSFSLSSSKFLYIQGKYVDS